MTDLERARRECRDRILGNVEFHEDPYTPRPAPIKRVHDVCVAALVGIAQCPCPACDAEMGSP